MVEVYYTINTLARGSKRWAELPKKYDRAEVSEVFERYKRYGSEHELTYDRIEVKKHIVITAAYYDFEDE